MSACALLDSPLGPLLLHWQGTDRTLRALEFAAEPPDEMSPAPSWLEPLLSDLDAYFRGQPLSLDPACLALDRFAPFTRAVYRHILDIPLGETRRYGEVAEAVGSPGAARAVGNAMAANPLPIIIPCHRVTAANGLGGYTGGLAIKRRLLDLEARPLTLEND